MLQNFCRFDAKQQVSVSVSVSVSVLSVLGGFGLTKRLPVVSLQWLETDRLMSFRGRYFRS